MEVKPIDWKVDKDYTKYSTEKLMVHEVPERRLRISLYEEAEKPDNLDEWHGGDGVMLQEIVLHPNYKEVGDPICIPYDKAKDICKLIESLVDEYEKK